MLNKFFKRKPKSIHRSMKEPSILDVTAKSEGINNSPPKSLINSITNLPKYVLIVDADSEPVLWHNLTGLRNAFVLIDESRNAFIVIDNFSEKDFSDIEQLQLNLKNHVYTVVKPPIYVTADLSKLLKSTALSSTSAENLTVVKSEATTRFKQWLSVAINMNASDIHFFTANGDGQIMVRVDGEMWPLNDPPRGKYPASQINESISSAYQNFSKRSSNSNSMWQPEIDSYTMLNCVINGKSINLRFQSSNGIEGPKIVLRIFEATDKPSKSFDELGYAPSMIRELTHAQTTPTGVVLFTGITGSGKTTAIRSFLEKHPDNGNIVINTIEDPVELKIKGAHQNSVQRSFEDDDESVTRKYVGAIAALLRQDIDIGMLGELRDSVTANAWLNIGETGHMSIGTLHAHRLTGIIPRLTNKTMGLSREVICSPKTINMFVYQALVPKLCQNCSLTTEEFKASDSVDQVTKESIFTFCQKLNIDCTYFKWRKAGGCECCESRGSKGQLLLAEILTPDDHWLELMREGKDIAAQDYHRSRGTFDLYSEDLTHRSIVEHGLHKVFKQELDLRTLGRFEKLHDFADKFLLLKNNKGA